MDYVKNLQQRMELAKKVGTKRIYEKIIGQHRAVLFAQRLNTVIGLNRATAFIEFHDGFVCRTV